MVSNRVTKTKTYLANATLHLRKWAMNDSLVQNVIDNKENKSERTRSGKIRHDNETYAQIDSAAVQNTLKDLPLIRIPIQLVFFFFGIANIAGAANRLQVTKRRSQDLQCFFTHWVLCKR